MVRSKELSEALRKKIVAAYESGKGFKKISKEFDISLFHHPENCLQVEDLQNNCHHAQVWPSKQVHPQSRPQDAKRSYQKVLKYHHGTYSRLSLLSIGCLKEHVETICKKIKAEAERNWTLQHDNDPKHTSKSTKDWLKTKKWRVLEWPSQSPDLNPIEMLWGDLKRAVHARNPSNISQLKEFCIEEWSKLSSDRCQRLVDGYKKRLTEVISAKGGNTSY
ncbi:hypothetical protein L3Q82_015503 [Scortum barcoo]|uniref:Uncharacterized protein n=1 Tax=Scortum barcoo TaxID=214431 RepID=A0ACB8VPM3_9TELE|nr:hypothetical protein L3Q82_015503 [Scortum barcoo]